MMCSRPRKSDEATLQWPSIVISWVNLFEEETLSKVYNIRNSKFVEETIKTIFLHNGAKDVPYRNNDDLTLKFIKEYFPEIIQEKRFNFKNEDDILILISLLMYTTCIKCKIVGFVEKTCNIQLDDSKQEAMKHFFELMNEVEDGNFTRMSVMNIIQQCFESVVVTKDRKSLSPTVQRNCLKEFLGSPGTQEKYKKVKQEEDLRNLNRLLHEENTELVSEKEMLTNNNKELEATVKRLQTHLSEKSEEIASLREELWQHSNRENVNEEINRLEKTYKQELNQVKEEFKNVLSENESLLKENEKYIKEINCLKESLTDHQDKLIEKDKLFVHLEQNFKSLEEKNTFLENNVKELNKIIEQYEEERAPNEEINMSAPRVEENLGQVLSEIKLQEKNEEIEQLQQICREKDFKYNTIEQILIENESTMKSLRKEVKQQSVTVKIMNQNCIELNEKLKEANIESNERIKLLEENIVVEKHKNTQLVETINQYELSEMKLREELQTKSSELINLQDDLQSKYLFIEKLQDELQSKDLDIAKLQDELQSKSIAIEKLKDELQSKCSNIEKLEDEFKSKCTDFEKVQDELHSKCSDIEKLKNELQSKCSNIKNLEDELQSKCSDIEKLEDELQSKCTDFHKLQDELQSKCTDFHKLQDELQSKCSDIEKLQDELQLKCLDIENMKSNLNNFCSQIKTSEKEIESLKSVREELLASNKLLEDQLLNCYAECNKLTENLKESNKIVDQLNSTVRDKDKQIHELNSVIQTTTLERRDFLAKISHQAEQIRQHELSENKLQDELQSKCLAVENTTRSLNDFKNQLKASDAEVKSLISQVKKLKKNNQILENNLTASMAENKELEEQLTNCLNDISQLNTVIADKECQTDQMKILIQSLSEEKKEYQLKNAHQDGEIKQLEISKRDLESKLESKSSEFEELSHAASLMRQQVNDLTANVENLNMELSQSLAKSQELEKQLDVSNQEFINEITEKDTQLSHLQEIIENMEIAKSETLKELQNQSEDIKQFKISTKDLENRLQSKCSEHDELSQAASSLQQQVDDLSAKMESVNKELSLASTKSLGLEKQLAEANLQFRNEIAEKDSQMTQLQEVIQNLEIVKKEILTQLQDQEKEITNLESGKKELESELRSKSCELDELSHASSCLNQQVDNLTTSITTLNEELSHALIKSQELEKQLIESDQQSKNEIAEKESQLTELQEAINNVEREKIEILTQLQDQEEKIKQLEVGKKDLETEFQSKCSEFDELSQASSLLHQQIGDLSSKNVMLNEELSLALMKSKELQEKLDETNKQSKNEIAEKESRLTEMQEVIENLKMEKNEISSQLLNVATSFNATITSLETKVEAKEAECVTLKKEIDNANSILCSLQSDNNTMDDKIKELTSQLSSMTAGATHMENIIQEDNFKIELQERKIKQLESDIHEKDEVVEQLRKEISSLRDEADKLASVNDADVANLEVQLAAKSDELNKLQADIEVLKSFNKQNEEILEKLDCEKVKLENDLKARDDEITLVKQELCAEKETAASLSSELIALKEVLQEANKNLEKVSEEKLSLQRRLENHDPQLKEAYDKLFDDYHRLNGEHDELKAQLANVRSSVRAKYEDILQKMKADMKSTCTRALELKDEKHAKELKGLQEMVKANQDHISQLSTNLWDTSDKLLITKNENQELKEMVMDLKRKLSLYQSAPDSLQRTRSHDQLGLPNQKAMQMVEETVTVSRRQSIRTVPSGIGKVFPSEDEAEEMFNNDCLADLKAGRCQVSTDPDRMSTLMYRNSLCPPHLKSSYPAETQFLPIDTLHEDDIKGRGTNENTKPDKRRKDRSQATELRNVSSPLRELNEENRKPGTPSRLFSNIFSARQRRNENVQATPDRRRLSFFGKLVKKEAPE